MSRTPTADTTRRIRLATRPVRLLDRALAGATGAAFGVTFGIWIADGQYLPMAFASALTAGILLLTYFAVPAEDRAPLAKMLVLGLAARLALAALLHAWSLASARGGFITGDDHGYFTISHHFVLWLKGTPVEPYVPPYWWGEAYLLGTWVYVESALFYVFGPNVLLPIALNGALMTAAALVVFKLARGLFDRTAAYVSAGAVAFFPSLIAWSSLNLKDALAILLIVSTLYLLVEFERRPLPRHTALLFACLIPLESLRRYIYVGLAIVVAISAMAAHVRSFRERLLQVAVAAGSAALLYLTTLGGVAFGPSLLAAFEGSRQAMSVGARTAFVEGVIEARAGDTFTVGPVSPSGEVVHVDVGSRIVLQPGTIVVVGPPMTTPAPQARWRPVADGPVVIAPSSSEEPSSNAVPTEPSTGELMLRTLRHLPRGLAYALFAPFPWDVGRRLDLLPIPEMLLWYVALAAAGWTVWRERRRWRLFLPVVTYALGTLLVLALADGNVGTLYRHRAMAIPVVLLLASPPLVLAWQRWSRSSRS